MPGRLVLASGSAIRARILRNAGIPFEVVKPGVDEAPIKQAGLAAGDPFRDIALSLAQAKATAVVNKVGSDDVVLGSDQVMVHGQTLYDKPKDFHEARERFLKLAGQPHNLINGTVLYRGDACIYRHIAESTLTFRPFTAEEIDRYLAEAGPDILNAVGAYQVEVTGIRLFSDIDGEYNAILGLALLPFLPVLRDLAIIDF